MKHQFIKENKPKDASTLKVNGLCERKLRPAFEGKVLSMAEILIHESIYYYSLYTL